MTVRIIPNQFKDALKHAVDTKDKRLLNNIELEVIRHFKIMPEGNRTGFTAVAVAEIDHSLMVLWENTTLCECIECSGTGNLQAVGATQSFTVDCPECDGVGREPSPTVEDGQLLVTDVAGSLIVHEPIEKIPFDYFLHENPLNKFAIMQGKVPA